jgi:uncharacterized RDD family membrane protein YckC
VAGNEWFYAQDNRQLGPVTIEALVDMLRRGVVQPTDLVWAQHMSDWRAAMSVPELMPGSVARVAMPVGAGAGIAAQQAGSQQIATGGVGVAEIAGGGFGGASFAGMDASHGTNVSLNYFSPVEIPYAGFWLRFCAAIIDGIIWWLLLTGLDMVVGVERTVFGPARYHNNSPAFALVLLGLALVKLALPWLYFALLESSRLQATLGKMAVGIIVTDLGGQRIGFGRATGRFFAKWLSYLTFCIGFMLAGWTRQKQALHDMIVGTLVLRKE